MHGAHILPKPAHFGCMAAICCHELALFPSEAPSGTHEAKKPPRIAARERTAAKYCHGRQPENASRLNIATVSHSRMHYSYILPIKSLHSCAKVQHARFSPCRIRAAVGYGERCRRCSVGHRERFRKHAQSWCWGISCRRGLPAAGERPATGRASAARPYGCGWAPGHGAGLSAASWTTGSGTVCHEPPFSRKNKHHVENENEPVHSDISPLLYSYRFYLLRNKYLALESTHLRKSRGDRFSRRIDGPS